MKKLVLFFAIASALSMAACSSVQYNTTREQSLDFSQYKTYGWLAPIDSLSKNYFTNDIAKNNILNTANTEIEARGLQYSKENPDILFRYITIVNNKSRLVYGTSHYYGWGGPWGMYRPWGWGMGYYGGASYPIGDEKFRNAHIILEAYDRKTNAVIWQARGSSAIKTPERAINNLPEIVQGIFKKYPIQSRK